MVAAVDEEKCYDDGDAGWVAAAEAEAAGDGETPVAAVCGREFESRSEPGHMEEELGDVPPWYREYLQVTPEIMNLR